MPTGSGLIRTDTPCMPGQGNEYEGCTAGSGNFTGEAEKGLGYCAGQTERTLAQISPAGTEIDYAIIYADYYYIEALLRLKDKKI